MILKPLPTHAKSVGEAMQLVNLPVRREMARSQVERPTGVRPDPQLVDQDHQAPSPPGPVRVAHLLMSDEGTFVPLLFTATAR